jgi:KipI family sensor histidine kinase inhibitor
MPHRNEQRSEQAMRVARAGDSALVIRVGDTIAPATHAQVMTLLAALDGAPLPGVRELVPAYASLLVIFDPLVAAAESVEAAVRSALAGSVRASPSRGRPVSIPVQYGGADGPDLETVAREVGLSPDEVVRRHAAAKYRVYFLGFLAGFPYLGGLPRELAVPRLDTPRAHVPPGSVGLAGQQTGIYPVASPGGWRLIGRTSLRLFDPARDPPSLLRPGDRVRFRPIRPIPPKGPVPLAGAEALADPAPAGAAISQSTPQDIVPIPWLRVVRPGPQTTVQDLGRPGYGRLGVSASGAADADALRLGNALLGNPPGVAALEVTLGGATFEALAPCAVALTGADCAARAGGRPLQCGEVGALAPGDALTLGQSSRGVRTYLCVAGGVHVPSVLGSRSTDVRAGLGGVEGRALRSGDALARGGTGLSPTALAGRRLPDDPVRGEEQTDAQTLRILPGPHATNEDDLAALVAGTYKVDPRSDRVGVRLQWEGEAVQPRPTGGETLSEGVPRGAVQLPPDGAPIILLADHQATGGYRVPAVVIAADLWRLAQLRPGETVRLRLTTPDVAVAALRARQTWLEHLAAAYADEASARRSRPRSPDTALLMRGFAEWSEEGQEDA